MGSPPQQVDPEVVLDQAIDFLETPANKEELYKLLVAGISVEVLVEGYMIQGFQEGKFTPDVAFIITEPVMKMLVAIGMNAGVEKIRFSLSDITNKKQMRDIAKIKMDNEDVEKSIQSVQKDIKKAGLMSKPEPEGEE